MKNFGMDAKRFAKNVACLFIATIVFIQPFTVRAACIHAELNQKFYWIRELYDDVLNDYYIYYTSPSNLVVLGGVIVTAGVLANSKFDRKVHCQYQERCRTTNTDRCLRGQERVGLISYPKFYVASMAVGYWFKDYELGYYAYHWGNRTLRAMFIVSPQITFLRKILGGGRPCNNEYPHSNWRFMVKGRSSCSGHTFNGALPFISAAMMTDNPFLKTGFYALSILPGLSRINDGKHYVSQVFLGWALAFMAARAVDYSDWIRCRYPVTMELVPAPNGAMMRAGYYF